MKRKTRPKPEFRNLQKMAGSELWQFEVKDSKGNWHTLTNLGGSSDDILRAFAQKTADSWIRR